MGLCIACKDKALPSKLSHKFYNSGMKLVFISLLKLFLSLTQQTELIIRVVFYATMMTIKSLEFDWPLYDNKIMHSSRMRTARWLTVSWGGGVCLDANPQEADTPPGGKHPQPLGGRTPWQEADSQQADLL